MARIEPVNPETVMGKSRELLDMLKAKNGMVPVALKTLAVSPVALQAYVGMSGALAESEFTPAQREQIALAVAQENHCDYCLSAHGALAKRLGLSPSEILAARNGETEDGRFADVLQFARVLVKTKGMPTDADVAAIRASGYSNAALLEIVALVVLNIYTNYFNHVADTVSEFPPAPPLE